MLNKDVLFYSFLKKKKKLSSLSNRCRPTGFLISFFFYVLNCQWVIYCYCCLLLFLRTFKELCRSGRFFLTGLCKSERVINVFQMQEKYLNDLNDFFNLQNKKLSTQLCFYILSNKQRLYYKLSNLLIQNHWKERLT